jgi:hypothetical protein
MNQNPASHNREPASSHTGKMHLSYPRENMSALLWLLLAKGEQLRLITRNIPPNCDTGTLCFVGGVCAGG